VCSRVDPNKRSWNLSNARNKQKSSGKKNVAEDSLIKVKQKELTVVTFITKRNTRRRSDLTAGPDAGNVRNRQKVIALAGLRKPWTISSAIIVKVFHKVNSEREVSVPDCASFSTQLCPHHWGRTVFYSLVRFQLYF
jgi:hypothetical protein